MLNITLFNIIQGLYIVKSNLNLICIYLNLHYLICLVLTYYIYIFIYLFLIIDIFYSNIFNTQR